MTLAGLSRCENRHGSVIVKNGRVLATASNSTRTGLNPDWADGSWRRMSVHAEEAVLGMAGSMAHGATLYVSRVNNQGKAVNSRPCKRCVGLAERYGIRKIVHT